MKKLDGFDMSDKVLVPAILDNLPEYTEEDMEDNFYRGIFWGILFGVAFIAALAFLMNLLFLMGI